MSCSSANMNTIYFCVFVCLINYVMSEDFMKGTLTFVIDNTGSMTNDIVEVIKRSNIIFDAVTKSNETQIQDYNLVTFNDPDASFKVNTKDHQIFKSRLKYIDIHGGDDCPEYSMTGIELALEKSRVGSYVYIFTDATAKDVSLFGRVKTLAQQKQTQVVFVMPGACNFDPDAFPRAADYQVYYDLVSVTKGQVFQVEGPEMGQILDTVMEIIEKRKVVINWRSFPPNYDNKFSFDVDSKIGNTTVFVTGKDPQLKITSPDGSVPNIQILMDTSHIKIVKVLNPKPGQYNAVVGSSTETIARVIADTEISFRHGFSQFKPSAISDTASAPSPDYKSYLAIKLTGDGVKLHTVNILDTNGNIIQNDSLAIVNDKEQFYTTLLPLEPPKVIFYVEVVGTDAKGNTIRRTSATTSETQNAAVAQPKLTAPIVTIDDAPYVKGEYGLPYQLKCRVTAYPQPEIIWEDVDTGDVLTATMTKLDLTEFMSILNISKVGNMAQYKCTATNIRGQQELEVSLEPNIYYNVVERPKDTIIKYNTEGNITCKIDARPLPTIHWYGKVKYIHRDKRFRLNSDNSVLTIINMQPNLVGAYVCEVRNDFNRKLYTAALKISGAGPPIIEKLVSAVRLVKGSSSTISCKILDGTPKPDMIWYMIRPNDLRYHKINSSTELMELKNIDVTDSGTYKCEARNNWGQDVHQIDVTVEYPPVINEDDEEITERLGTRVILRCDASGDPAPKVTWLKDGKPVTDTKTVRVHSDLSISLKLSPTDGGSYICYANNTLGSANRTIKVTPYEPVSIKSPNSTLSFMVDKYVVLACDTQGYPQPKVKWTFFSSDRNIPPKDIMPKVGTSIIIPRIQLNDEGFYRCIASNVISEQTITYIVTVNKPPVIEKVPSEKTFKAVLQDLALRLPCKASGRPKPTITWSKDGFNIISDSNWYDIDDDGTLILKNIDDVTPGKYTCTATNDFGSDINDYEVIVEPYPQVEPATATIMIGEGKSADVQCQAPHVRTDELRWYKDGEIKAYSKLRLENVTRADSGLYICRVNNFIGAHNGYTKVEIGFSPRFLYEEVTKIDLQEGTDAYLICEAEGLPAPEVTWWHDGTQIKSANSMIYTFQMKIDDKGKYECKLSNKYGRISREFELKSQGCYLDVEKEFTKDQPLLLSSSFKWLEHDTTDGFLYIPKKDYISLSCPSVFTKFPQPHIIASCDYKDNFKIGDQSYKYSDFKCREEIKPVIEKTGRPCLPGNMNTEKVSVMYEVSNNRHELYEVCLDKDMNLPLYVKHDLNHTLADVDVKPSSWIESDLLPLDFESFYDCKQQKNTIYMILRRWFHRNDQCCFARRPLINPRDMFPGLPQLATFNNLIVAPHWSTCNSKNWDELENRVRTLSKTLSHNLQVWTGTAQQLQLRSLSGGSREIFLRDSSYAQQAVPLYFWKVIHDRDSAKSLAVIQLNIPDVTLWEARKHLLCKDICSKVKWMANTFWRDLTNGYTYCCQLKDFEMAFGYVGLFNINNSGVL